MKLWRVDAFHDADGAMCRFFHEQPSAVEWESQLLRAGWQADPYEVDLAVEPLIADRLCSLPWPLAADELLIEIATDPVTKARASLDQIVKLRERHRRRTAAR